MARTPLTPDQIDSALNDLAGWTFEEDQLKKSYTFKDFRAAISFIVRMSYFAEELNHHPNLHNVYNTVDIALTTHDAGNKVTDLDVQLAKAIEGFVWV